MGIQGDGDLRIRMEVGIDDRFTPARETLRRRGADRNGALRENFCQDQGRIKSGRKPLRWTQSAPLSACMFPYRLESAGFVLACTAFLSGCVHRKHSVRPSIVQLIEQSLSQSLANYEIDDPNSYELFTEQIIGESEFVPADVGHVVGSIDGAVEPVRFSDEFIETDVSEVMVELADAFDVEMNDRSECQRRGHCPVGQFDD